MVCFPCTSSTMFVKPGGRKAAGGVIGGTMSQPGEMTSPTPPKIPLAADGPVGVDAVDETPPPPPPPPPPVAGVPALPGVDPPLPPPLPPLLLLASGNDDHVPRSFLKI
uniref:Uncharacterized protein n=1 Tax=Anopheles atroparvus TaxID=41427 RepID=A0A182JJN3_ANOAO